MDIHRHMEAKGEVEQDYLHAAQAKMALIRKLKDSSDVE